MAATVTTQIGVSPTGTLSNYQSWMNDPNSKKAISLMVTSLVNDILKSRGLEFKKSAVLGIVDYVSLRLVNGYFQAPLQQLTGESVWSSLMAEGISLSLSLMLLKKASIVSQGSAEGIIDSPNVGSGPIASYVEDVIETAILLAERQALMFVGQKTGVIA